MWRQDSIPDRENCSASWSKAWRSWSNLRLLMRLNDRLLGIIGLTWMPLAGQVSSSQDSCWLEMWFSSRAFRPIFGYLDTNHLPEKLFYQLSRNFPTSDDRVLGPLPVQTAFVALLDARRWDFFDSPVLILFEPVIQTNSVSGVDWKKVSET